MIEEKQKETIKETVKEFFDKTTLAFDAEVSVFSGTNNNQEEKETIDINVKMSEPQILIGSAGQTLIEIQRLLRMILSKKMQKSLYVNLDINGYKKQKVEHLKQLAKDSADQAVFSGKEQKLYAMSPYERRIIHSELADRQDIIAESEGQDPERYIVIKPK